MNKQMGYWKGFGSCLILLAMIVGLGVTAGAASKRSIEVEDGVSLSINGADFTPRDVNGREVPVFRYNGTVYAPVRAVCEAAGMDVEYVSSTGTVELTTADRVAWENPDYISGDEAKAIALKNAGVAESDAVFLKVKLDWDDGRPGYDVEFYSGNVEYDYEIHAVTGAILENDRDMENFRIPTAAAASSGSTSQDLIGTERAKEIALAQAPSGTWVKECKLDWDDGQAVYELEMRNGRMEYECKIGAVSGTILKWESDYD